MSDDSRDDGDSPQPDFVKGEQFVLATDSDNVSYYLMVEFKQRLYHFYLFRVLPEKVNGKHIFVNKEFTYPMTDVSKIPISKQSLGWKYIRGSISRDLITDNVLQEKLTHIVEKILSHVPVQAITTDGPLQFFLNGNPNRFISKKLSDNILNGGVERFFALIAKKAKASTLYHYKKNRGYYRPDGEAQVRSRATNLLDDLATEHRIDEVVGNIRNRSFMPPDKVDANPTNKTKVVVGNGVLNLDNLLTEEELVLEEHDPDLYALSGLPVDYIPGSDCPKIKEFIKQITGSDEDLLTLQEWIGYHLLRQYPFHKALMLIGEGSNGKTTFLNLLRSFLGKENCSNVTLHQILYDNFAAANIYGKLANISDDISHDALKKSGPLKMLTGESGMYVQFKHRDGFDVINVAKASFAANRLPATSDLTDAFFRRWLLISFPYKFEKGSADPHLFSKLTTEEELQGLLIWGLEGLKRLLENGGFSKSATTEEIQKEYDQLSNPYMAFRDLCMYKLATGVIPTKDMYRAYYNFALSLDISPATKRTFETHLQMVAQDITKGRQKVGEKYLRVWEGYYLNCMLFNDFETTKTIYNTLHPDVQFEVLDLYEQKGDLTRIRCGKCQYRIKVEQQTRERPPGQQSMEDYEPPKEED